MVPVTKEEKTGGETTLYNLYKLLLGTRLDISRRPVENINFALPVIV